MKRWRLLIALNLFAAIVYIVVGLASGLLEHVQTSQSGFYSVFSANDSVQYHAVADWIYGARSMPASAAGRPFLYPLLLGLADRIGGVRGIWLLNVLLWFAMLNFAAAATYRFVKSVWAAAIVFLALAVTASLIVLTFKGLTEITTVALLAVWMYGLTRLTRRPTPSQVAWTLLPAALLVVVKPEFELLFGVMAIVLVVGIVQSPTRGLAAVVFAACLIPVVIQLAMMAHFFGYFGISNVGGSTLRGYFLPRLEVAIGQSSDYADGRLKIAALSNAEAVQLVLSHFGEAVIVFFASLKENLLAGDGFIRDHLRLSDAILVTQSFYFLMVLAWIPLSGAALWRGRDGRLALLCIAMLNVLVAGGLTFNQGDRITIIVVPLLLVTFVLAIYEVRGGRVRPSAPGSPTPELPPVQRALKS